MQGARSWRESGRPWHQSGKRLYASLVAGPAGAEEELEDWPSASLRRASANSALSWSFRAL